MADLDAWDAEDFEPELPARQKTEQDKWEGEDEDDGVRDNWEDNDEENGDKKESESQAYQRPKKKPIGERLAEKEAQEKQEKEEKKAKQKEEIRDMTAEEKQAEKERMKKIKEQESLSLAKGLFAENSTSESRNSTADNGTAESSLDQMTPLSESEFDQFGEALRNKIQFFEDSQHYAAFVVQLINDLSLTLGVEEVKKLGVSVNSLYHEKERQRKETEKKKKKKSKAVIKVDRADDLDLIGDATGGGGGQYYDDDDFI